jgi:hypothetical protein
MTTLEQLHKPRWQPDGDNWLMIVGNHVLPRSFRIPTTCSRNTDGCQSFSLRAHSTITAGVP